MRILYFGDLRHDSTSRHRADALSRIGCDLHHADPYAAFAKQAAGKAGLIHYRTGYRLLQPFVERWLSSLLSAPPQLSFDIIWVNSGELFGHRALQRLRLLNCPIVLYMNDDPTGGRDGRRFDMLLTALPLYDLCAVVREPNINEFLQRGAKAAMRVWMSYDEQRHLPYRCDTDVPESFRSDVVFVGTWIRGEGRDRFLLDLIQRGVNVAIWGDRWQKSPGWRLLKPHWRGPSLSGRDYVAAIQGAKLALGLLSKGNRDLHTRRSVEIPFSGGLLCAERTAEHLELYRENAEAVFWSDAEECAAQCKRLLANDSLRDSIRAAGRERVISNRVGNEDICRQILAGLSGRPGASAIDQRVPKRKLDPAAKLGMGLFGARQTGSARNMESPADQQPERSDLQAAPRCT